MHTKWYATLRIFLAFVALAGALDLASSLPAVARGDQVDGLSILFIALDFTYLIGGLYLFFNIKKLLPHYRTQLVRAVTGVFLIEVLFTLSELPSAIAHPEMIDAGLPSQDAWWFVFGTLVGLGFSYLVYSVIVTNINQLAGVQHNSSPGRTMLYWGIVALFLAYICAAIVSVSTSPW